MRKVAEIIINILTIIVFVVLAIMIFAKVKMMISQKDYFEVFGYSVFNVATGSMEPTIKKEDIILVKKMDDYKEDDIITFVKEGSYITHRIMQISDNNYITRGDANNTDDPAIPKEIVIGKVIHIFPSAGIWQKILTSPKVIIMIFVTLILFDFAFSYKGFKSDKATVKSEKIENDSNKIDINNISKEELEAIYKKVMSAESEEDKKNLEYTIGLDLSSIQKEIESKLDKGE